MPPATAPTAPAAGQTRKRLKGKPFLGLIDAVVVESPVEFQFDGAIPSDDAEAAWIWMARDIAPDLIDLESVDALGPAGADSLEALMPELLERARKALADAATSAELTRRIKTQLGGDEPWDRLPAVLNALKARGLLDKAGSFGRAANGIADEAQLALAMQSMPLRDKDVVALLMQAAVLHMANPTRLVTAAIRISGSPTERDLIRAGFAPLIDAILAQAQNQIPALSQVGTFGDMDLMCRSIDRFHRLMRAVTSYVELTRAGRWAIAAAGLTKTISEKIEPRLRDVAPDLNKAMRRRDGTDRVDSDLILSALNGMYLLSTVRDCRDSLAVNATFDQVWSQTGQALEIHIERYLEQLRANPADAIAAARLDAALKMAELRFSQEYADTLRRAKDSVQRRA
jgi:hypothetical protein